MDKKKFKPFPTEDIKGFEEFIENQQSDKPFLPRGIGGGTKKDFSFEHFTSAVVGALVLFNDSEPQ